MVRQKWSTEPCYRRGIQLREYSEHIPVALTQYLRERQRLSVRTMDNGPQHPSTVDVIIHLQLYFQIIILLLKEKKIRTFWNYTNRKQDVCKIFTIYFYYVLIVANCGPTPVVERAVVNVDGTTLEGSIRYYQCTGGSVMEGEYNITCGQDGRWSDVRFYCRRTLKYDIFKIKWYSEFGILMLVWLKQCIFRTVFIYLYSANCNQPPLIPRATVDTSTGTLEGDIAVYTCGVNTVQEGFGETVCQKNGMWSEVDMYCRRKY